VNPGQRDLALLEILIAASANLSAKLPERSERTFRSVANRQATGVAGEARLGAAWQAGVGFMARATYPGIHPQQDQPGKQLDGSRGHIIAHQSRKRP